MFSWLSFLKCLISVSLTFLTFLTATISLYNFPLNTAPCAPLPNHSISEKVKQLRTSHMMRNSFHLRLSQREFPSHLRSSSSPRGDCFSRSTREPASCSWRYRRPNSVASRAYLPDPSGRRSSHTQSCCCRCFRLKSSRRSTSHWNICFAFLRRTKPQKNLRSYLFLGLLSIPVLSFASPLCSPSCFISMLNFFCLDAILFYSDKQLRSDLLWLSGEVILLETAKHPSYLFFTIFHSSCSMYFSMFSSLFPELLSSQRSELRSLYSLYWLKKW